MNEVKITTFSDRLRNAIKAFKGSKVGHLYFGMNVKHCDKCEYKQHEFRDNLLVTAGTRAAYMDDAGLIEIPQGVEGEAKLAKFIAAIIDCYLQIEFHMTFDEYIERSLTQKYGPKEED